MALAGDHVRVKLDDSGGTLRTFDPGDIISVDVPLAYRQHDVTGMGDDVEKVINGQQMAPVTIRGYLTPTALTGTHTVIKGAYAAQTQVTLEVEVGQNAAPVNGDPRFKGEFFIESYKPSISNGGAIAFVATLKPAVGSGVGSVPAWGTVGS
jgi:hypothetical protein